MGTILQDLINVTLPVCASKQTNKYKQTNTNKYKQTNKEREGSHFIELCSNAVIIVLQRKKLDSFLRAGRGIFFASIHPQIFITEFSVLKITQLRWSTNLYCP